MKLKSAALGLLVLTMFATAVAQVISIDEMFSAPVVPDQPHMRAALDSLKSAKGKLQNANNDKGGHRAKAMELIDLAIDEVNKGIAAAS